MVTTFSQYLILAWYTVTRRCRSHDFQLILYCMVTCMTFSQSNSCPGVRSQGGVGHMTFSSYYTVWSHDVWPIKFLPRCTVTRRCRYWTAGCPDGRPVTSPPPTAPLPLSPRYSTRRGTTLRWCGHLSRWWRTLRARGNR